ncbi:MULTISPECIES: hypothetical protein [Polyangium]|uniref:Uncharacterized protein n=2 Tax=Polyangium TaxID=55 RepID=A0A4U1JB33_9BACT|nr:MULTISPECIES: hypothetical protein [Polyangium]MDI1432019.1 hypothetical protein [Polyangium sorediatum]TKD05117.1 hypothetical protein E8A74_21460 [Polyangium fumosum]
MSLRLLRPASLVLALVPIALVACAAAPKSGEAPATAVDIAAESAESAAPPPPPAATASAKVASDDLRTPDDAATELDRWEISFLNVMVVADEAKSSAEGAAPPAAPTDAARKAPTKPVAPEATSAGSEESPCHGACRAYASMKRAATRLCDLAGKEDDRCAAAQQRIDRANERLKAACPRCESLRD